MSGGGGGGGQYNKNTIKQQLFSTGKKYTYTTLQCPDTKQNRLNHVKHKCIQKNILMGLKEKKAFKLEILNADT